MDSNNPHLSRPKLNRPALVSALVALVLTAWLYGDALTLPLFSDDLVQIPWLESISWRELWTSPSPYGYYRPLWYSLWRVWGALFGGLRPWSLHLLNVLAHFVASWLIGLLSAAWMRPTTPESRADLRRGSIYTAGAATALFALFPFARQAVAWPGAVYNPLVSAMAAGALLAYDRGRDGGSRGAWWIGLALLLALLAAFHYEAGLLVGPLVVLAEGVGWIQQRWRRRYSPWPLAFVALFVATALIWRSMRGPASIGLGLQPPDLRRNVAYVAQGAIYPTAPLAQQGVARLGLNAEVSLWLVAAPTLALLAWGGLRRDSGTCLLGAGWAALFAAPPLISMEADWFALAPRFLYMTAGGIALMWAAATGQRLARPRPLWQAGVIGALLVASLSPAAFSIRKGMRLYRMAGESIWGAAEAATADEDPLLLVNLPMRITPRGRIYPLGFEGITPLPQRVTAEGLVSVHTGIQSEAEAVAFSIVAVADPPGYSYQLHGRPVGWEELGAAVRQAHAVHLTRYEPDRIRLVEAGGAPSSAEGEDALARFGERLALLDAAGRCNERGQIQLVAHWQVEDSVETDATVFAHLLGPDGALVAQADGHPLLGMLPFWLWEPGETLRDVRYFDPVPAGEYTIRLGVWDLATGERWTISGPPRDVVLLPVDCP